MPKILYEDNHLLVVEKPPNLPTQADDSGDADLLSLLKEYIREKYQKPGAVYLGLVHRLDRPVGGVMVFARTSKAASRLSAQFAGREAEKRYVAIVEGEAPMAGEIRLAGYIAKDAAGAARLTSADAPDAKPAKLEYRPIGRSEGCTLLDIRLLTGRKHQIRLQLAGANLPILHDQRYNPRAKPGNQICLWAYALRFTHPTRKEAMEFFSLPGGGAWAAFPAAIAALPAHRLAYGIYLDPEVLIAGKRAGVEAADGEAPLSSVLVPYFGPLRPVHRLDANTEGLLIFARTEAAEQSLLAAFREGRIEKRYRAIVRGAIAPGVYDAYLTKADGRVQIHDAPRPGAKPIRTEVCACQAEVGLSLLTIRLWTGRTHQIRAHLAHLGYPVLGDDLYGDRALNAAHHARRQRLLAAELAFAFPPGDPLHALDGKRFTCPWGLTL